MQPTLREVLTPLIAYVLLLEKIPAEQQRSCAEVRGRIDKLIAEQRLVVKRYDISTQDYESACFAAVAWIDEIILRATHESNRALYDKWRRSPLQAALFGTANAGQEFFDRLDELGPDQKELCEVYFLALSLGFRGKYYDDAQENQLIDLRRQCAARLREPVSDLLDLEKRQRRITPEPYSMQPPVPKPVERRWPRWWLAAPIAALAAVLLFILWPWGPDQTEIRDALKSFECSQITVDGIDHGVVKLVGHVESDQQKEAVRQKLQAIRGVKGVSDDLNVIERPFCEVMEVLDPPKQASLQAGFNLQVQPSKGCSMTYYYGDRLVVDVTADKPLHYVYIDYYTADRATVVHYFPNAYQPNNAIAGSSLTLGAENGSGQWHMDINPPYGTEMLTVVSSPKPLFAQMRPDLTEPSEVYLTVLRHELPANSPGSDVAAAYCFVTTRDKL